MKLAFTRPQLEEIFAHLRSCYPHEGCGLVVGRAGKPHTVRGVPNVYAQHHAQDPAAYPRSAADAFLMDPREQLRIFEDADKNGDEVLALFHSHPDAGSYFSAKDKDDALGGCDEPLYPDVCHLVVSVVKGQVAEAKLFHWDQRDFVAEAIPL